MHRSIRISSSRSARCTCNGNYHKNSDIHCSNSRACIDRKLQRALNSNVILNQGGEPQNLRPAKVLNAARVRTLLSAQHTGKTANINLSYHVQLHTTFVT